MARSPEERLKAREDEDSAEERELYLRDGRKLVVGQQGGEELVEIRGQSGMVELRIRLTEEGPVLQLESVRLSLQATEAIEIASPSVTIHGSEQLALQGGAVAMHADHEMDVTAEGNMTLVGEIIHLNPVDDE